MYTLRPHTHTHTYTHSHTLRHAHTHTHIHTLTHTHTHSDTHTLRHTLIHTQRIHSSNNDYTIYLYNIYISIYVLTISIAERYNVT